MNERNERRLKPRFPRTGVAGFSHVVLVGMLALSAGVQDAASASAKRTVVAGKAGNGKQVGQASWYGPGFHGKKTASGATFNQNQLTAAHRSLPLGTKAKVTNLENGKKVEVTINDRGPYVGNRAIDLSRAAARRLAMDGTARVRIEALP